MQLTDSVIVSFDCSNGMDKSVLVVGHKTQGEVVKIINAFQGKEAEDLWRRLTYREDKKNGEV